MAVPRFFPIFSVLIHFCDQMFFDILLHWPFSILRPYSLTKTTVSLEYKEGGKFVYLKAVLGLSLWPEPRIKAFY